MKSVAWMLIPVILVLRMPALTMAGILMISMLVMLTMAVQKGWFRVQKKKTICGLWGIFMILPLAVLLALYFGHGLMPYQQERILAFFSGGEEENPLKTLMNANKFVGSSAIDVDVLLPEFNRDYILSYLSSMYGILAGIFPSFAAFLPFISAGGSYIIVSYGLMGIVLSIYRYKNVYPRHVKISDPKRKSNDRIIG